MKKIYLVDSENVGDIWVLLLASSQPEDEVLVFYTQKSPHMSYENVRMLKETDKEAVFIKCFEGSNALDFQLVTELGFRLRDDAECEYIIVSNDTGFDAAVRYWALRDMPVGRLSGKECYRNLTAKKQKAAAKKSSEAVAVQGSEPESKAQEATVLSSESESRAQSSEPESKAQEATALSSGSESRAQSSEPESTVQELPSEAAAVQGSEPESEAQVSGPEFAGEADEAEKPGAEQESGAEDAARTVPEETPDDDETVKKLFCCISKENLADFHNALVALLGEEKGKALYQEMKGNAEYTTYWSTLPASSQREKFDIYCSMVFAHSEFAEEAPEDFASFLYQSNGKRKNLNSLRAALQGHYGKDKGMKYYSLFKTHIKIMNRM